jgi:hypothetical protein
MAWSFKASGILAKTGDCNQQAGAVMVIIV